MVSFHRLHPNSLMQIILSFWGWSNLRLGKYLLQSHLILGLTDQKNPLKWLPWTNNLSSQRKVWHILSSVNGTWILALNRQKVQKKNWNFCLFNANIINTNKISSLGKLWTGMGTARGWLDHFLNSSNSSV